VVESLFADIRFALRWLRKSPGFALVAIASLAIGIGFNTALFTIVDALLFKPLPVAAPDRLVDVYTSDSTGTVDYSSSSYPDYLDLQAENQVFDGLVGYSPMMAAVNLDTRSRLAMGEIVTGNYFQVFGVPAAIGRTIVPADDAPGAPRVAMVSHRYWTRELGSAPDVVGRIVRIRGSAYTIVGVAPRTFNGMVPVLSPELWIPVAASLDVEPVGMHDTIPSPTGTTRLDRRADRWLFIRGRLQPHATIEQARANLGVLMARIDAENPVTNKGRRLSLRATSDVHFHPAADPIVVSIAAALMAVVGLVLLIACANVASMLLARASSRQKEIGIRLAIGASRARLMRQLLTEAIVLSCAGAAAAMLLAWWLASIAGSISLPLPLPLTFDLRIDGRVLAFNIAAAALAALLAGVAPGVQASKRDIAADFRGDPPVARGWTLRDGLVAGQMAVTALLLIVAALLMRSLAAVQRTNPGFAVHRLAVVSTDTSMLGYPAERSQQFFDQATARIAALPAVESVALATRVPLQINPNRWEIWVPGRHQPGDKGDTVEVTTVSPEYFATMGVPIVEGRGFTVTDRIDTPRVAVVNETLARRLWPGQSAIGKVFHTRGGEGPAFEIVGVSADHKVLTLSERPTPFLHVARAQRPSSYTAIVARTRGDSAALLRDMRRELLALDPNVVFIENQTLESEVDATLLPMRASAWLVTGVGLVAMLLAAIGLYGVIAYSVARRTREIGIRIAVGARPSEVVAMVMRQGLIVAGVGLIAGCLLAVGVTRAMGGVLYGVSAADPPSWLAAAALLLGVSMLANFIPAHRASRVSPTEALRTE
jgi:putative ABC transport system permease protein